MTYDKTTWVKTTPFNATNMNNIEDGIVQLVNGFNSLVEQYNSAKIALAQVITACGVETSSTDTFATMANNIRRIEGGEEATGEATGVDAVTISYNRTVWENGSSNTPANETNLNNIEDILFALTGSTSADDSNAGGFNALYNAKEMIAEALVEKGVEATANDSFNVLTGKIATLMPNYSYLSYFKVEPTARNFGRYTIS